jgi:hypothetical protein
MVKNERKVMIQVQRQFTAEQTLRDELEKRTISMWRSDLETLTNSQLRVFEGRVARLVNEAVVLAEQRPLGALLTG